VTTQDKKPELVIVYDGQCLFCSSYVMLLKLRNAVGSVSLVDARESGVADDVRRTYGRDLDEGMLVIYGGTAYHGADAMHVLSTLTSDSDAWNATTAAIFRRRWLARLLYPFLKLGRRIVLAVRGRTLIDPSRNTIAAWLVSRVPVVSAETLALCRIMVGLAILYFMRVDSWPTWTDAAVLISAAAFTVGALTRIAAPLLALSLWACALANGWGHFITPLLLGMTVTSFAPWGAAWSVDQLVRPRPTQPASPYYGYAIWLLGLIIGLTYMAAGLSKLVLTSGGWLWDTGARNGFIQDADKALSDLGIYVSNNYWLALGASILSSFGQIIYVWAAFTKSARIKYAIFFLVALPFLLGLVLTMGLFWWPWAILVLVLYLPWESIDRLISKGGTTTAFPVHQKRWFVASTVSLIALHFYAVGAMQEREPFYSNYPMYAAPMRGGSEHETLFWTSFKDQDRHWRPIVTLLYPDGAERDVSWRLRVENFLMVGWLYHSQLSSTLDRSLFKGEAILRDRCERLQANFPGAVAIRFDKTYLQVESGAASWLPVDPAQSRTIDLVNCSSQ
jgi:predicted DCC family thiol-disulfide oxidoreductase YuxK